MALKQRIAVHASEFHKKDVQAYHFILAIVSRDQFKLTCLLDEKESNTRSLMLNPDSHYLFAFEIEPKALKSDQFANLESNWSGDGQSQEPKIEEDDDEEMKVNETKPYADELLGKTIPQIKSSLEIVEASWIPVLLLQN